MRAFVISSLLAACRAEASLPLAAGYGYAAGIAPFATHGAYANAALTYGARPLINSYAAAPVVAAPAVVTKAVAAPAVVTKAVAAPAVPSVSSSQYRAGDELGNDAFGYSNINSARQESRTPAGVTGSYSYVDEAGLHTRTYVADAYGFRVTGDNLPVAPVVAHRRRRSVLAAPLAATYGTTALNAVAPLAATYAAAPLAATYAAAPLAATYAAAPLAHNYAAATYAAAPLAATYAAAPLAATYATAPVAATYAAAPLAATHAAATYAAPAAAAREAVLTTIKLNPGHATAYRVD